ncbi:PKD domain-containing protein [Hymenobacter arizonensis]|uniref:YD repeat-containing protein n=1 Tax=Hymenobacter arizonensis TaxID=1227077 RepID=A0A1I6BER7_HYMAR|nr:PKD domain-containing protein [Hymenobacter arizonensis]SFQ79440.1 YD repeat-containing protein [Hymenobacter arizonensis]
MATRLLLCFCCALLLLLSLATAGQAQALYQAESGTLAGGAQIGIAGDVRYAVLPVWSKTASVAFSAVSVVESNTYAVDFRYAAGGAFAPRLSVYVNGRDVTQVLFPSTSTWANWTIHTVPLALRAGSNTVMVRYDADDSGGVDLDYIQVRAEANSQGYKLGAAPTAGWFPSEISVDKFTGTAQLYLPLHTVAAPGISLPLGLAYAATGVRVDDQGGAVGVNWALTGGVRISREVRGLPDDRKEEDPTRNEFRYGWLVYNSGSPEAKMNAVPTAPATFSADACVDGNEAAARQALHQFGSLQHGLTGARHWYDSEPDVFSYSLPGHSGKFVFDAQGHARTIPFDPINITPVGATSGSGITSFTIRTADGTVYDFNMPETVTKKLVNVAAAPSYFLREYWQYKLPDNAKRFAYATAWLASSIRTPAGAAIGLEYWAAHTPVDNPARSSRLLLRGGSAGAGAEEYRTETQVTTLYLRSVVSDATRVDFTLVAVDASAYYIQAVEVKSGVNNALIRRYDFNYTNAAPSSATGQNSFDSHGNPLSEFLTTRRFLRSVHATNGCASQPLYEFTYHGVEKVPLLGNAFRETVALPPVGANDRDYWGYYTPNHSPTLVPRLHVYPALLGPAQPVPGAPYRLYEVPEPTAAAGGFTLPGAERRPAACFNFQAALAGTLKAFVLPGGGKALLEYEPHRFYDAVAQQSYPAGGTRIRAVRVQDPVTGLEARRDYGYEEDNGRASGVLLRAPRFAFALPASGDSPQQQWTNATVRCGDDLTEDPFEGRAIGYRRVSEQMTGRGRVVTVYQALGSADEAFVAEEPAAGLTFAWSRAIMGLGRATYTVPRREGTFCPSAAPLRAGTGLYPFAPATNYDFRRGLPLSITYQAEPVGNASPATVRRETFAYEYRDLTPTDRSVGVTGLAYEQLTGGAQQLYAYAKYSILTDFLYAIRRQTEVVPNGSLADNQSETWYNYNAQGWLASQGRRNSDGKAYRTRYKYLADYDLTGSAAEPRFQAMQQRIGTNEHISATPVETITELVLSPTDVRFAGATLNTFAAASPGVPTRPYQVLRWQPAAALPRPTTTPPPVGTYDSIRVVTNAAGGKELYVSPSFRLVSTVLETSAQQLPLSTRTEAGRQRSAVQLDQSGTVPVLQIANALSSEVLFSDFESAKPYGFSLGQGATLRSDAARTGTTGASLPGGSFVTSSLVACANTAYRLSFWARTTAAATVTVSLTAYAGGGTAGAPPAQPLVLGNTDGTWRYYEATVNLSGLTKPSLSNLALQLQTSAAVQLDDVLFLPSAAAAASTTYDLAKGKTSETDGRGQTTYYDYNVLGDLARVRDHNGSVVKQLERVVAGRAPEISPSFTITGSRYDGETLSFTAATACSTNLQYSWDFGDGTKTDFVAAPTVLHRFTTGGQIQSFAVTLLARVGQGQVFRSVQYVEVRPAPLTVVDCVNGVVSIDNCGEQDDVLVNTCSPNQVPSGRPSHNVYTVTTTGPGLVYRWEYRGVDGGGWSPYAATGASIRVLVAEPRAYRCTLSNSNGVVLGMSQVFSILRYNSQGGTSNPCGLSIAP